MSFAAPKVMVITAANSDFARAVSLRCAELGIELFLSVRSEEKASSLRALVAGAVPKARLHTCVVDVAKAAEVACFARWVAERTDAVDVLVNNAAHWADGPFAALAASDIQAAVDATFIGSVLVARAFLPWLQRSKRGDIVNICSMSADPKTADDSHEAYVGAKHAQATFADAVRAELRESGVRITTIYPARFQNLTRLDAATREPRGNLMTAQQVWNGVWFAISQDRSCTIDSIRLSNTYFVA